MLVASLCSGLRDAKVAQRIGIHYAAGCLGEPAGRPLNRNKGAVMGLLLVQALCPPDSTAPAAGNRDFVTVAVSVTDGNGNPRTGLADASFVVTGIVGPNVGTVGFANEDGSGSYGVVVQGPEANPDGSFTLFKNGSSVLLISVSDSGDIGQALFQHDLSGRP
jgi:hypothetical protein